MTKFVTDKQKQVLEFIQDYIEQKGVSPTHEEIRQYFGFNKSVVAKHLAALEKKKKIEVTPRLSRAIRVMA